MPGDSLIARAVLFDMDGTLVDSNATVDAMWTSFALECGLDPAEVRTYAHGVPSSATLQKFLPADHRFDEWFARVAAWESDTFGHVSEIPGAIRIVRSLPPDAWAVVTSALREAGLIRLDAVGFPAPTVLIGADDVERGKPDPQGFVAAAEALGVEPHECVVFEDSPPGLEAAIAAGATAVVVGNNEAPVTRGLRRLHDWTGVTVTQLPDGQIEIVGIPEPN